MQRQKVALIHTDLAWENSDGQRNPRGAKKMLKVISAVSQAIISLGYELETLPGNYRTAEFLQQTRVDLVFNVCTGVYAKDTQVLYAGILEKTGVLFTGSGYKAQLLALHKDLAKVCFSSNLIPTPNFQVVNSTGIPLRDDLKFPLFIKPVHEGSSMGIPSGGLVKNMQEYQEGVAYLLAKYNQPVLVEKFIPGREFTVGILGNAVPVVLPILELDFREANPDNYTNYNIKSKRLMKTICPAQIDPYLQKRIEELALQAYYSLGCRDFARVDIRLNPAGELFVLEVNCLPALYHGSSITIMAEKAGMEYRDLIGAIINSAMERGRLMTSAV